jgi:thiamine biosynthesis lipoprotein
MSGTIEVRRARPLLGTLVEIAARGGPREQIMTAIDRAFAAIECVHRLMSFHEADSDVSCINRRAHRVPVQVHPWTWRVLREALRLSRATRGAFDVTVADRLVRWGYLPRATAQTASARSGDWRDVRLLAGHRVRLARPVLIDLGGIAKGFAVDRAVAALRNHGSASGLVNAGGDLRAFGALAHVVYLRHPASPGKLLPAFELVSGALATSADYFARRSWRGEAVAPITLRNRRTRATSASVTVEARTCMLADALTKICLLSGSGLVRRLGGRALVLRPGDASMWPVAA